MRAWMLATTALFACLAVLVASSPAWADPEEPPPPAPAPEPPVEYPKDEPDEPPIVEEIEDVPDDVNESPAEEPGEVPLVNPPAGLGGGSSSRTGFAHRRDVKEAKHSDRIKAALNWLKDHQNAEGYWNGSNFGKDSTRKDAKVTGNLEFIEPGKPGNDRGWEQSSDIGVTGLALLAFAGAGCDHKMGDYRETCRRAVMYLRKVQSSDGCIGAKHDDHYIYGHAIATTALCEIYGLSGDAVLKPNCLKAVNFILDAQNPGSGWRYGVRPGVSDTSVTGWMISALKSAKLAGLEFKEAEAYKGAQNWLETATALVMGYPKTGYDSPGGKNARLRVAAKYENNPCMDAIQVFARLVMNQPDRDKNHRDLKSMASVCCEYLPDWDHHKLDFYFWYYGTLAMYQMGGIYWKKWEPAVSKVLLDSQRGWHKNDKNATPETVAEHGSWDPLDAWGTAGGRVYSTAINCLTLQIYNRYLFVADENKAKNPPEEPKKEEPKEQPKRD